MPAGAARDMLVVLDADPNSRAGLQIAERYARGTVALAGWDADPPQGDVEVIASASSEPTVAEALKAAAQRQIAFVSVRRDLAPPERLLGELLVATADHASDGIPGFAVFLVDGEPPPFARILSIVDHRQGALSGLATYVGVAVAATAGAHIDVLVIGDEGEAIHSELEEDLLAVNRETELFERARTRAREARLSIDWLPAGAVADAWSVIADQLSQHDYDLVIHDLGEVSLGRRGRAGRALEAALAPGGPGEVPLRLLTEVDLPLLLVLDEIRLGVAPMSLLKAGAVAAVSLGIVSTPLISAGSPAPAHSVAVEGLESANALIAGLEEALGIPEEKRRSDAGAASRGGQPTGARAQAQTTSTGTSAADTKVATKATTTTKPVKPKIPKGGATPADVAKANKSLATSKSKLATDKANQKKAQATLDKAKKKLEAVEKDAQDALEQITAAQDAQVQAQAQADTVHTSATGILGILPGGPTEEDLSAAQAEAQAAQARLDEALQNGEKALETLTAAEDGVVSADAGLATAKQATTKSRATYQAASAKAKAYKQSLAKTRQPPVEAGKYRLTARYGQAGGYWSSGRHTGLDFAGSTGTPIRAAASGTVVEAGYAGAYGNRVVVKHSNGYETTYNHLSKISVKPGQKVQTGDRIGALGSTGNSTGPHLHFEVLRNGSFLDPEAWLGW